MGPNLGHQISFKDGPVFLWKAGLSNLLPDQPCLSYLILLSLIKALFSPSPSLSLNSQVHRHPSNTIPDQVVGALIPMATASATLSPATFAAAATAGSARASQRRTTRVNYISGLNSFGGLKAHNNMTSLGLAVCTEQSFANIVSSLKVQSQGKGRGGGALSSTCNAAGEIFRIAAIMNGLVLVGVAVGFVLLRIEASVEEAE
ncbi:hypothetical protein NMG60_11025619 [Bertholletia excelsa]